MSVELETGRILLRTWRNDDLDNILTMNQDPEVMQYFPHTLNFDECYDLLTFFMKHHREHGYGIWAVEELEGGQFIGAVGLNNVLFEAEFTPCVEIVWTLNRQFWGQGYALEAAMKSLEIGFLEFGLSDIVAFTAPANVRSLKLMRNLSMKYRNQFRHPSLPADHPLSLHHLYGITVEEWKEDTAAGMR